MRAGACAEVEWAREPYAEGPVTGVVGRAGRVPLQTHEPIVNGSDEIREARASDAPLSQ